MYRQLLNKPQTWAVIMPVLIAILVIYTSVNALGLRRQANEFTKIADETDNLARNIINIHKDFGDSRLIGAASRNFVGIKSALECAQNAGIPRNRLTRLSRNKQQVQKDGRILQGEHYQLQLVTLVQVVQFLDYAERNFSSLSCPSLDLTPVRGAKSPDTWTVRVQINYLEK